MKKIFLAVAALLVLVVLGFAVFIATFDANRYKSHIEEAAQKILNKPVEIDRVSLGWSNGVALQVKGFRVYPDSAKQSEPSIRVQNTSVLVKLLPILQKQIQITAIQIEKPFIEIVKNSQGAIEIGGIDLGDKKSSSGSQQASNPSSAAAGALTVDSILIKDGTVIFKDLSGAGPAELSVRKIDLRIQQFSLDKPFSFKADAQFLSQDQNLHVTGAVSLPQASSPFSVSNLVFKTSLSDLDLKELGKAFPGFEAAGIENSLQGSLAVSSDKFSFDPAGMAQSQARVQLTDGKLKIKALKSSFDRIQLDMLLRGNTAELTSLKLDLAGGAVEAKAKVTGLGTPQPVSNFRMTLQNLSIADLMKEAAPGAPQLNGHLNLDFEGQAQGLSWEPISRTLNGRSRIVIQDGVLLNYNMLREVIQKLSVIPGAEEAFQNNFPQAYRLRLQDQSTLLKPVDLSATVTNGVFNFNPLYIGTDFLVIQGAGQVALDKRIAATAVLQLNQEISQALIRGVRQVSLIANPKGEIEVPLAIDGVLPQVRITPDKQYIISKLVAAKTQEVVADLVSDPEKSLGNLKDLFKKSTQAITS